MKIMRLRREEVNIPQTLAGFEDWEFVSNVDFTAFTRLFREWLVDNLPSGAELARYDLRPYYVSGIITRHGKHLYFSIPDVRRFPGRWKSHILIQIAKDTNDYKLKRNHCVTSMYDFQNDCDLLLEAASSC